MVNASIQDKTNKGCFLINSTVEIAPHDEEVAAIVTENMKTIEDALFYAIKKGQKNGEISNKHSARALARFVFNTISGLRIAAKAGADKNVYDDVVKVALSILQCE
jgi:TetR/AcrR family transcriptional repressor of nem operon